MSASVRIRLFGSLSATASIWSAQKSARLRPTRSAAMRALTRRRFSIRLKRSMIGIAHSSPIVSAVTL